MFSGKVCRAAGRGGSEIAETGDKGLSQGGRFDLPPEARIRLKRDFDRIFASGKRIRLRSFTAVVARGEGYRSRVGIVAGRKVSHRAVRRNRIRRRLREVFRLNQDRLPGKWDIILLPAEKCCDCPWNDIVEDFDKLIGILVETRD